MPNSAKWFRRRRRARLRHGSVHVTPVFLLGLDVIERPALRRLEVVAHRTLGAARLAVLVFTEAPVHDRQPSPRPGTPRCRTRRTTSHPDKAHHRLRVQRLSCSGRASPAGQQQTPLATTQVGGVCCCRWAPGSVNYPILTAGQRSAGVRCPMAGLLASRVIRWGGSGDSPDRVQGGKRRIRGAADRFKFAYGPCRGLALRGCARRCGRIPGRLHVLENEG